MRSRQAFTLMQAKAFTLKAKKAFTLIEAISVVAIIGILMTSAAVLTLQAKRSARDAQRKNDLFAINESFQARYLDRTCANASDINHYPGMTTAGATSWAPVSVLVGTSDCNGYSAYESTIPKDPQSPEFDYYFNLSGGVLAGTHYRLGASLEKIAASQLTACVSDSNHWVNENFGVAYDCASSNTIPTGSRDYNYFIGQ